MTQTSIPFTESGAARFTDPSTSQEAAVKVDVAAARERILEVLRSASDGMTAEEIHKATGLPQNSCSTRMSNLLKLKEVHHQLVPVDDPKPGKPLFVPRTRETSTETPARIYYYGAAK